MTIVVINEDIKHMLDMLAVEDQEPVETLGVSSRLHRERAVRHKPFASPTPSIRYMAGRFS